MSLYKDKGSVDVVREVPLLRRKGRDETALDGEEMSRDLAGGTHHQVSLKHIFGENFILGQGMVGSTDTGYGGRRKRFETKSAFFLSFFEVKSRADLLVLHKPQKGGEWYHPDRRAKERELQGKLMEEVRQQFQSHAVMAADLQRDQALMSAETLFGGEGGLQDQFRVRKELQSLPG